MCKTLEPAHPTPSFKSSHLPPQPPHIHILCFTTLYILPAPPFFPFPCKPVFPRTLLNTEKSIRACNHEYHDPTQPHQPKKQSSSTPGSPTGKARRHAKHAPRRARALLFQMRVSGTELQRCGTAFLYGMYLQSGGGRRRRAKQEIIRERRRRGSRPRYPERGYCGGGPNYRSRQRLNHSGYRGILCDGTEESRRYHGRRTALRRICYPTCSPKLVPRCLSLT